MTAHIEHRIHKILRNTVVLHIHEPSIRQCPTYLLRHLVLIAAIEKGRDVNHWDFVKAFAFRAQLIIQFGNDTVRHEYPFCLAMGVGATLAHFLVGPAV
ncbi:hypothetical protein MES4922_410037 [Mesorhizobium ventifaucium]|uniref:Uncharacterized protein n=1 Tax=Mesorhizobium ventifaucium TaxID=666020 RepID=A0ABN8K6N1_9HYPH|nr:hypothetical protein MES4922_410037 [Mesorhizobium ventifaucium]